MRCVVKGCESKSTGPDKVSFFRFPKENSHEWIANLRPFAPGVINADNDRVCEKHFEKESIRIVHGRKILNVNVNPTLFELSLLRYSKSERKENNSNPSLVSKF
ncbi:uncharacterized protein LOC119654116 [Hermetia illucens]|uniref:uncharacterized protein LOC119654116 n=1 Tax=Hermetia illucens TaxID=343691 RepID=UPI0018CC56D4|nr:uncharacterized protein LOC119654116 [Hermetia illucens]